MTTIKDQKGYLNGQFLQASALSVLRDLFQNPAFFYPAAPEARRETFNAHSLPQPGAFPGNAHADIFPASRLNQPLSHKPAPMPEPGAAPIPAPAAPGARLSDKELIHLAQQSAAYKTAVAKGLVTMDGIYGKYTRGAMEILVSEGKLDASRAADFIAAHNDKTLHAAYAPGFAPKKESAPEAPQISISLPHAKIFCAGDSIGKALGDCGFKGGNVTNFSVNGQAFAQTVGSAAYKSMLQNCKGSFVVLSDFTNDLKGREDVKTLAQKMKIACDDIRAHGGVPVILDVRQIKGAYTGSDETWRPKDKSGNLDIAAQQAIVARWNGRARELNKELKTLLGDNFVETDGKAKISADNLHPDAEGVRAIKTEIAQTVARLEINLGAPKTS